MSVDPILSPRIVKQIKADPDTAPANTHPNDFAAWLAAEYDITPQLLDQSDEDFQVDVYRKYIRWCRLEPAFSKGEIEVLKDEFMRTMAAWERSRESWSERMLDRPWAVVAWASVIVGVGAALTQWPALAAWIRSWSWGR